MEPNAKQELIDQLRIIEKMLRALEQLGRDPAGCNPELVRGYALRALNALKAAEQKLSDPPTLRIQA